MAPSINPPTRTQSAPVLPPRPSLVTGYGPVDVAQLRPSDTLIALMGMTGAGKSTFISHCTDVPVDVGHSMNSCTQEVAVYPYRELGSRRIFLVDTPGFDDTNRTDTQVLKEIATWLTDTFNERVQLSGIIYLHRISDNRVQGSAKRNLFMFKKLCGPQVFSKVRLATTMWDIPGHNGEAREKELIETEDFWGYMIQQGAKTYRHYNNRPSALKLVDEFLSPEDAHHKLVLNIQAEMQAGATLEETGAGQEVDYQLREMKKQYEKDIADFKAQQAEALAEHDKESARVLHQMQVEYAQKIDNLAHGREQLRADMEKLHKEREEALIKRLTEQEEHLNKLHARMESASREERRYLLEQIETERVKNKLLSQQVKSIGERIKRRATHQTMKTTLFNRMKDGCSLAVYKNDFVFAGANYLRTNYPELETRSYQTLDETMYFAFGEQQSWYRHYHSQYNKCYDDWSSNFAQCYPGLYKHLTQRKKSTCPSNVALGFDGVYYFRDAKNHTWHFSYAQQQFLKQQMGEGKFPKNVRKIWLGVYDSMVCLDTNRNIYSFDLDTGNYPGLEKALEDEVKNKRNIKAVAMSLSDSTCWFAAWKYTHSHRLGRSDIAERHFVQWCRMNQGTK